MRRRNQLSTFDKKDQPLKDRLLEKIKMSASGCWNWTGHLNSSGYGMIWSEKKPKRAHRMSFAIFNGALSERDVVCHSCDNRACVNPAHLFKGTRADNNKDAIEKNRHAFGEKNGSARLTTKQVLAILADDRMQAVVAKKFGVTQSVISRIRNGQSRKLG